MIFVIAVIVELPGGIVEFAKESKGEIEEGRVRWSESNVTKHRSSMVNTANLWKTYYSKQVMKYTYALHKLHSMKRLILEHNLRGPWSPFPPP